MQQSRATLRTPLAHSYLSRGHWAIVLAGGEGTRMTELTAQWFGEPRPKQYCAFFGEQTLLEQTLGRVSRLIRPERILTIIGRGHRRYLEGRDSRRLPGFMIEQPDKRGTTAGVLVPLAFVLAADPEAVVFAFPSDHFVEPDQEFVRQMMCTGIGAASLNDGSVVLVGVAPSRPETDYGWIHPGTSATNLPCRCPLQHVQGFHEKPNLEAAEAYFKQGFLWNSMILVAKARALWRLGWECVPSAMEFLEPLRHALARRPHSTLALPEADLGVLSDVYRRLPNSDISRDLLQPSWNKIRVLRLHSVDWDDLGRPRRLLESLRSKGLAARFSQGRGSEGSAQDYALQPAYETA